MKIPQFRFASIWRRAPLDILLTMLLALFGLFVGTSKIWKDGLGSFYANRFGPAVMWTCGEGLTVPVFKRDAPGPSAERAYLGFLDSKDGRLDCATLRQGLRKTLPQLNGMQVSMRYLLYAAGLTWTWNGLSWISLAPLFGVLCGLTAVAVYWIGRLLTGRLLSAAATVFLVLSPLHLSNLPHLRDYAKAPFLLGGIALLGAMLLRETSFRTRLLLAMSFGAVTGVGLGFRTDALLLPPLFLVAVLFFWPPGDGAWRQRAITVVVASLVFVLISLPVTLFYAKDGSNFWHFILLGLSNPHNGALGVESETYFLAPHYNDSEMLAQVNFFATSTDQPIAQLASVNYDHYGRDLYFQYLARFPADLIVRAWASALAVIGMPTWLRARWGLATLVLGLTLIALHDIRKALFGVLLVLYFGGLASLQFNVRHYFHLEFFSVLTLAFLAASAFNLVRIWFRGRERDQLKPFLVAERWKKVGLFWLVLVFLALALTFAARAYQQTTTKGFLETLASLPTREVETEQETAQDETVLFRPEGLAWNNAGRLVPLPQGYLEPLQYQFFYFAAAFGGPNCPQFFGEAVVEYEAIDSFHDQTYRVPLRIRPGRNTLLFFPAVFGSSDYFRGLRLRSMEPACLLQLGTVRDFGQVRLPLTVLLDSGWEDRAYYQQLNMERRIADDLRYRRLRSQVTNVFQSGKITGRDAAVAVRVPLNGANVVRLSVDDGGDQYSSDHADWIAPTLVNPRQRLPLIFLGPFFARQAWGRLELNRSVTGQPLRIGDQTFETGFGTHADSEILFQVPDWFETSDSFLETLIGIDGDTNGAGSVRFHIDLNNQ